MINEIDTQEMIRDSLIPTISCGDQTLGEILTKNFDSLYCVERAGPAGCNETLMMLYMQKALLNRALNYSREMVDTGKVRGSSGSRSKSVDRLKAHSESQRSQAAEGCSWSTATTFRQFERNSESHDVAYSKTKSASDSNSFNQSYDRSRNWASGYANSLDNSRGAVDGDGSGWSYHQMMRQSHSRMGTAPQAGAGVPSVNEIASIQLNWPIVDWNCFIPKIILILGDPIQVIFDASKCISWPEELLTVPEPGGYSNPGRASVTCPRTIDDPCPSLPSYGQSWSTRFQVAIGIPIPLVGVLNMNIGWTKGGSFNQNYTCGGGRTFSDVKSGSLNRYAETSVNTNHSESQGHDENHTRKDAHQKSESHSQSKGSTDGSSNGIARSKGDSRSGADRAQHSQSETNGQSTATAMLDRLVQAKNSGESVTVGDVTYWSQIFDHLQEMWKRTMAQIKSAQSKFAQNAGFSMQKMIQKDPIVPHSAPMNAFIRQSVDPCFDDYCSRSVTGPTIFN